MNLYNAIAFIAPEQSLYEAAKQLNMTLDFKLYLGDMPDCIGVAMQAIKNGAEVIISRGGTASVIREQLKFPVVEVRVTLYDIIRTLNQAKKIGSNIAVIGYENIIHGVSDLAELLNMKINQYTMNSSNLELLLKKAQLDKNDVLVGGSSAVRRGMELGLPSFLITSGQESILSAVEEAKRHIENIKEQRDKMEEIKTIFASIHDGILSINKDLSITNVNQRASELLGIDLYGSIGNQVSELIPHLGLQKVFQTRQKEIGRIQKIKDKYVVENHIPIIVEDEVIGAVCTIQDVTEIQKTEERARKEIFKKGLQAKNRFIDIVTVSNKMKTVMRDAELFANVDSTVFITGESGTGKELIAQSIHNASHRKNGPFVAVNCATFTESLLESELFGYIDGAFTGAKKGGKPGLFELAHEGTLFLDEIGEMPYRLQAHLLRVLQEGEIRRIGADYIVPVNVRIIAATNVDIDDFINKGRFRADLYYRLNILQVHLPPLRERMEDIPYLISKFIEESNQKANKNIGGISSDAIKLLQNRKWSGNIRELKNFIEKLVIISAGPTITAEEILPYIETEIQNHETTQDIFISLNKARFMEDIRLEGTLEEIELRIIKRAIEEESGNLTKVAKRLGIHRTTLHRKIKM